MNWKNLWQRERDQAVSPNSSQDSPATVPSDEEIMVSFIVVIDYLVSKGHNPIRLLQMGPDEAVRIAQLEHALDHS